MAYFHLSHLQPQILLNSTPTVGMQNGRHRKATRGSCDIQQAPVRVCLSPPPRKLLGFKVVWFILEPLPLEVVGVLPSQALGVLPDVGTI